MAHDWRHAQVKHGHTIQLRHVEGHTRRHGPVQSIGASFLPLHSTAWQNIAQHDKAQHHRPQHTVAQHSMRQQYVELSMRNSLPQLGHTCGGAYGRWWTSQEQWPLQADTCQDGVVICHLSNRLSGFLHIMLHLSQRPAHRPGWSGFVSP